MAQACVGAAALGLIQAGCPFRDSLPCPPAPPCPCQFRRLAFLGFVQVLVLSGALETEL